MNVYKATVQRNNWSDDKSTYNIVASNIAKAAERAIQCQRRDGYSSGYVLSLEEIVHNVHVHR